MPAPDEPEPAPLILNLHGAGSNALQQSIYSELPARGAERGYLVVTPQAVDGMWELAGEGPDDRFLTALLDEVAAEHCVDLDRVHAAGFSLGAWKATVTACTHPERFASLALVAEEVAPPELYAIVGGEHTWPGSPIEFSGTTTTIDATQIALDWFDAHPRSS